MSVLRRYGPLRALRIGPRLIVCFALILLLFITGDALSLWQIHTYSARVQELDEMAQQVEAVQRVNTNVLAYQQTLLKCCGQPGQFSLRPGDSSV